MAAVESSSTLQRVESPPCAAPVASRWSETLVALAILAIVITTTIAMFAERTRRLREANETILAFQALSNEAEYWRREPFAQIDKTDNQTFKSDLDILEPLTPYTTDGESRHAASGHSQRHADHPLGQARSAARHRARRHGRERLVVTRRRARGYTMMEIVVTLALFGVFLFIIVTMTAEMRRNEKKWPVNFFAHPEVGSVLARMRRDIYDSTARPRQLRNVQQLAADADRLHDQQRRHGRDGGVGFQRRRGEVHRRGVQSDAAVVGVDGAWPAAVHGALPESMPSGQDAMRIRAVDKEKKLAIDELIVPRPHA